MRAWRSMSTVSGAGHLNALPASAPDRCVLLGGLVCLSAHHQADRGARQAVTGRSTAPPPRRRLPPPPAAASGPLSPSWLCTCMHPDVGWHCLPPPLVCSNRVCDHKRRANDSGEPRAARPPASHRSCAALARHGCRTVGASQPASQPGSDCECCCPLHACLHSLLRCSAAVLLQGTLRGYDQATNLILDECHERVYSSKVSGSPSSRHCPAAPLTRCPAAPLPRCPAAPLPRCPAAPRLEASWLQARALMAALQKDSPVESAASQRSCRGAARSPAQRLASCALMCRCAVDVDALLWCCRAAWST